MAEERRKKLEEQKQRRSILLCALIGTILFVASGLALVLFLPRGEQSEIIQEEETDIIAYDAREPFSLSDLSQSFIRELRESKTLYVSDGPRGISVGDPLEILFERFPTDYQGEQPEDVTILYCAAYFDNVSGSQTALPPRGLLAQNGGREIVVTYLAPTSAYPPGTRDDYRKYEHIFLKYTIQPDTGLISQIQIGLTD